MKSRTFVQLIEAAAAELYGKPLDMIEVIYDPKPGDDSVDVTTCLALPLGAEGHFAEVVATAMYMIWEDRDALWNADDDKDEALGDFRDLVCTMRVAPYMQWTAIYFPGITKDDVETDREVLEPLPANPVIAWNTGRGYSEHGQRIGAVLVDHLIYFADIDRGIFGVIDADEVEVELTPMGVMRAYDNGMYNGCSSDTPHIVDAKNLASGVASLKKE